MVSHNQILPAAHLRKVQPGNPPLKNNVLKETELKEAHGL
jgi:hypothetical protein